MKCTLNDDQQGFTLIELLIATIVFSVIMLVASATLIQIGKMYYKGIITSRTQDAARSVVDSISRAIQFSNVSGSLQQANGGAPAYTQARCIGNTRYTYALQVQVDDSLPSGTIDTYNNKMRHVLWQDTIKSGEPCSWDYPDLTLANPNQYPGVTDPNRNGRELLENNMRLQDFDINLTGGTNDLWNIRTKIVYYVDPNLLNNPANPTSCKGTATGGQWCAISDLSSVVYSRSQ